MSWSNPFDDPIPRSRLVTLQDAGTYIMKLPKSEHTAPEWQAAMEALILVATLGGPLNRWIRSRPCRTAVLSTLSIRMCVAR
jgi:hypothetical protein